jgi:hypothetical protein
VFKYWEYAYVVNQQTSVSLWYHPILRVAMASNVEYSVVWTCEYSPVCGIDSKNNGKRQLVTEVFVNSVYVLRQILAL